MHLPTALVDDDDAHSDASMASPSSDFCLALQELKDLRPYLHSAADYCESGYLFNDQKEVVLENLKDYATKALVNAVDHLGTVAYKLEEALLENVTEISSVEASIASLFQRLRSCEDHRNLKGFSEHRLMKRYPRYQKHYLMPGAVCEQSDIPEAEGIPGSVVVRMIETDVAQLHVTGTNGNALSKLHNLAYDQQNNDRSTSGLLEAMLTTSECKIPTQNQTIHSTRSLTASLPPAPHRIKTSSSGTMMKHLRSQSSLQEKLGSFEQSPLTSRSSSLLSSLFGRNRHGKLSKNPTG